MESINNNNYNRPISENRNIAPIKNERWLIIGLILLAIIVIPALLNLFSPTKKTTSKTSKSTIAQVNYLLTPSTHFSYDTAKAQQTLDKFIKDNLKEEFLPAKIEVKQNLPETGAPNNISYAFTANWKIKDDVFNASLHFTENSNNLRDAGLYAIIQNANNYTLDEASTATLIKTYFKTTLVNQDFTCGIDKNTSFCESFKINEKGKIGFGVAKQQTNQETKNLLIFSCLFPKNDSYYNERTSCLISKKSD